MKKYVTTKHGVYMVKGILGGVVISLAVMAILTGVSSVLLVRSMIAEEYGRIAQMVIHILAISVGCLITDMKTNGGLLLKVGLVGAGYTISCVIMNIVLCGGKFHSVHHILLSIVAGMAVICMLRTMGRNNGSKRYKKWKL